MSLTPLTIHSLYAPEYKHDVDDLAEFCYDFVYIFDENVLQIWKEVSIKFGRN